MIRRLAVVVALTLAVVASSRPAAPAADTELVALFRDWRAFQKPPRRDGVPDYSALAMETQRRALPSYQHRLAAMDPRAWPIGQQVDYQLVRAEMNGLDFDQRVLRPWATNPAFYVTIFTSESDQPAREGPHADAAVEVWTYTFPLTEEPARRMAVGLRAIPPLLQQARTNLVGKGRDLWTFGTQAVKQQSADLAALETKVKDAPGGVAADVRRAREATDSFAAWLAEQAPSRTGPSGVGIANYDWYLKNVQLAPYTWAQEVTIMQRELSRAHALLAMEEQRNAALPPEMPIASAEEHARRFAAAVTEYMAFLKDHDILTVRDDMEPALRGSIGPFDPGPREFFTEVDYRDPEVMRTHAYHWFDKARLAHDPHPSPVRREALLYNIFDTRTEGHATGWEELMMQAGMLDSRPRSRELVYILLAERAARALGDLRMHSNEMTLEQAAASASAHTPRGWLSLKGALVRDEQFLYLQQPTYGTSYLIGKIEIEKLLAERRRQQGDAFRLKAFMDEFNAAGLIPASLIRWELTGQMPDDVRRMLAPAN
jgi:Bacterial protein of unknown function (DUF885)